MVIQRYQAVDFDKLIIISSADSILCRISIEKGSIFLYDLPSLFGRLV